MLLVRNILRVFANHTSISFAPISFISHARLVQWLCRCGQVTTFDPFSPCWFILSSMPVQPWFPASPTSFSVHTQGSPRLSGEIDSDLAVDGEPTPICQNSSWRLSASSLVACASIASKLLATQRISAARSLNSPDAAGALSPSSRNFRAVWMRVFTCDMRNIFVSSDNRSSLYGVCCVIDEEDAMSEVCWYVADGLTCRMWIDVLSNEGRWMMYWYRSVSLDRLCIDQYSLKGSVERTLVFSILHNSDR